jgi:FkbM family methyltransferase
MPLVRAARTVLHRLGFDLIRYDADRFPELRRPSLLCGRAIDLVLDVGANEGQYAEELRRNGYLGRIVSFEPLESAHRELTRRAATSAGWETHQFALGDTAGTALFHVAGNSSSSSLLAMAPRHVTSAPDSAYVAEEQIEVRTLDEMGPDVLGASERVWLKLDVQGYELAVLRGGERTLDRIEVVETELSLVELYEGQALLPAVVEHLADRGFGAWFFEPVFRDPSTRELLQVDGILRVDAESPPPPDSGPATASE